MHIQKPFANLHFLFLLVKWVNVESNGKGPGKMVKNVYESNSIFTEGKRERGVTYFIGKYIPLNNYYCQIQRKNIIN